MPQACRLQRRGIRARSKAGCGLRIMAQSVDYPLNWGQASSRDSTVYGVCRPGGQQASGPFAPQVVDAWAAAVKSKGVTRIVSLLDEGELALYEKPLGELYGKHFKRRVGRCSACAPALLSISVAVV